MKEAFLRVRVGSQKEAGDKETSTDYEVGLKGRMLDNKVDFALSACAQKFNGYIYRVDNKSIETEGRLDGAAKGLTSIVKCVG